MVDILESKKTKERSPTFPFITLENAIERARQFFDKEKRSSTPYTVAAGHWGYSPTSSGALQTASALKSYGLLTEDNTSTGRALKLTDIALRILLDTRPDDTERKEYMRMAATNPTIVAEVYSKWPSELPSDASLNHYLVLEKGFNQDTARKAVTIINNNHALTYSPSTSTLSDKSENNYSANMLPAVSTVKFQQTIENPSIPPSIMPSSNVRVERVIDPEGIDIILQFNGEPTIDSYEFIKDYIELRIKAMQRTAKSMKEKPE